MWRTRRLAVRVSGRCVLLKAKHSHGEVDGVAVGSEPTTASPFKGAGVFEAPRSPGVETGRSPSVGAVVSAFPVGIRGWT
ncbi:unnamed protein product [Gadus morhua 'NCC']